MQFRYSSGFPSPLGPSPSEGGINFAIYAPEVRELDLWLFSRDRTDSFRIALTDPAHRTGDVWHVWVDQLPPDLLYGYQVSVRGKESPLLLDPYALQIDAPSIWSDTPFTYLNRVASPPIFDWEDDCSPSIPIEDLIFYELHVRGWTQDPSSCVSHPGTFLGVIDKIPYLKDLGINAVELMPIYEFPEWKNPFTLPSTPRYNYWGYAPVHHFVPMRRYGTIHDCKQMVKALHRAGIEVILDVVYNHTAEGEDTPLHFRAFAPETYYLFDAHGRDANFSGCGNTLSCNHPIVQDWIVASLRYWVTEMHIDGFRFDLASILCRDPTGHLVASPPVIQRILEDPVLKNKKLIAEAWDAGGAYQVGSFSPSPRWMEWNGRYRDEVRAFIKGTPNAAGEFATRLCGSVDLYKHRGPQCSVHFVCCHDGFTLRDLVSYTTKQNLANGEENRDGTNQHISWNCGCEGHSSDPIIETIRLRQMKNFLMTIFLSKGTPLLQMGDEYGHSKQGNNNSWGLDTKLNWFQWKRNKEEEELVTFCQRMIHIRKRYELLRVARFLTKADITFHGIRPNEPLWNSESRLVAYTLHNATQGEDLYVLFHAYPHATEVELPPSPTGSWYWQVDTYLHEQPKGNTLLQNLSCTIPEYTAWLLSSTPTALGGQAKEPM